MAEGGACVAKVRSGTLACVHMLAVDGVDSGVTDLKDRELGDEAVLKLNFYERLAIVLFGSDTSDT